MSIAHRIGCRRVCVSRAHALTASRALVAQARQETALLAVDLGTLEEHAEPAGIEGEDSKSSARSLSQTLAALDALGWPHEHGAGG